MFLMGIVDDGIHNAPLSGLLNLLHVTFRKLSDTYSVKWQKTTQIGE